MDPGLTARLRGLSHRYGAHSAIVRIDLDLPAGGTLGIIGPDGACKSTLLGILAGAKRIQSGEVMVLGGDLADRGHQRRICPRIAYMPQGLGRNLYPELSVRENIAFFSRLFSQGKQERQRRAGALLKATASATCHSRSRSTPNLPCNRIC